MLRCACLVIALTFSVVLLPLLAQGQGDSRTALDALDAALEAKSTPQNIPSTVAPEKPETPGQANGAEETLDVAELRSRAEQGDAKAQRLLARKYNDGAGLTKNLAEAFYWYRRSAEL